MPMRKGDWWYSTQTRRGEQYPHLPAPARRRAGSALRPERRRRDPARPERAGARPAVPSPGLRRHARREAARLHDRPDRRPRLHAPRQGPRDRRGRSVVGRGGLVGGVGERRPHALLRDDGRDQARTACGATSWVPSAPTSCCYEEADELFDIGVGKTLDERYLLLGSESKDSTEWQVADADIGADRPFALRTCSRAAPTSSTTSSTAPAASSSAPTTRAATSASSRHAERPTWPKNWKQLIAPRDHVMLDDVDVFAATSPSPSATPGCCSCASRLRSGEHTRSPSTSRCTRPHERATPSSTRDVALRLHALVTPRRWYDYDLATRERKLLKQQPVLGGYDPAQYASERIWRDGARTAPQVPISLVYRKGARARRRAAAACSTATAPTASRSTPTSLARASRLLDRGVVFAIAHIRGGGDLRRSWYDDGKMLKKKNTFTDFIACAEHLVARKLHRAATGWRSRAAAPAACSWARVAQHAARPFKRRAEVPFVDVINTMLDETLPLTVRSTSSGATRRGRAVRLHALLLPLRQHRSGRVSGDAGRAPRSTTAR